MSDDFAVKTWDLSKKYKLYKKSYHRVLEALSGQRKRYHEELWALRDVNIEVAKGSVLGIVGSNGAGKSTLLKLLTGTSYPTTGRMQVNGKISALLELGAGFHPDFTGHDNIYMNASILGFTHDEIDEKYEDIVRFSELGDFIQQPVRIYSSGMVMRLGFSVAISMDPDVMIIDEILAVGDQHFQKKCIDRIHSFKERGKTILFCSHTLYHVRQICDRAIWIKQGRVEMDGNPIDVTNEYGNFERRLFKEAMTHEAKHYAYVSGTEKKELPFIESVELSPAGKNAPIRTLRTGQDFDVTVRYTIPDRKMKVNVGVAINRADGIFCFGSSIDHDKIDFESQGGIAVYRVQNLRLLAGEYNVSVYLADDKSLVVYDQKPEELEFKVEYSGYHIGLFLPDSQWVFPKNSQNGRSETKKGE
ncbi:MAG: ABC transporter ATP-binding protein [Planctomycetes bacterium]|nr:ABC transporter ATP-binding protein [Planctomycetota bacterium]MBI3847357.1 ABC transporter ATP-binding protein [Planctomycetota bacterium]